MNRDYYYIPLHPVIDAIKYRVLRLTSTIKAQYTPSEDRKEYICLRCGSEWTELDVLSLYSEEGFECQSCGAILERTEDVKGTEGLDRTGHEKNSKLMAQLESFTTLLKQIDATEIPVNDFETAWDHKVEVIRNQQTHPSKPAMAAAAKQPAAVRGNQRVDAAAIEVSVQSSAEKTAAEQEADAARKAAFEKQNALPVWHTHSTVSNTAGNVGQIKAETDAEVKAEIKDEGDEAKPGMDALDDIAAYYAEIAKAKAEEATSPDEDDSDDEEEDDDFEDISVVGTPAATTLGGQGPTSAPALGRSPMAGIKRDFESESGSSAPQTATGTPGTPADDGPASKKIKTEDDAVKKEEESDEDEEEFEDVS